MAKAKKPPKAKPDQPRLPGTEDAMIEVIHTAALDYAKIRDRRQLLTAEEVDLKAKLLDIMHRQKREKYVYQGVTVEIKHLEETVKVKIAKEEEE